MFRSVAEVRSRAIIFKTVLSSFPERNGHLVLLLQVERPGGRSMWQKRADHYMSERKKREKQNS